MRRIKLVDVAGPASLNYIWTIDDKHPYNILDTIGNGCAFLDYNNDGNLDILLVGKRVALYQGDGKGHFVDVSHETGLEKLHGDFRGCAVGDYDNDGYEDIYLSAYHGGVLLHNNAGKSFTDVTAQSGIPEQPWGTSAAFVDLDNDGKLDLYVGDYVAFGPASNPQVCPAGSGGVSLACSPLVYKPIRGCFYKNLGDGRFQDITRAWNGAGTSGNNLGVAFADFDGSGYPSVMLTNDAVPADLLKNSGHGFTDIGAASGTATTAEGGTYGGMGVDWGDYDNDGKLDLAVGTYQFDPKCIFHNDGSDVFTEKSSALGTNASTNGKVTFGLKWVDLDNDGWLDLVTANGHVQDGVNAVDNTLTYRQSTLVFYNDLGRRFEDISSVMQPNLPIVGRGLSIGDFDNDGRMDILIVDSEGKPILLHNETASPGNWLECTLIGSQAAPYHSNRDGQGALVTANFAGRSLLRLCTTSGSYESASDKRVHFGLGTASTIHSLVVQWPDGHKETWKNISANQFITLQEGSGTI